MIGQSRIGLAMLVVVVAAAGVSPARAQGIDCRYFKVSSDRLSAFEEPRGDSKFIAALDKNSIVCVAGDQEVSGRIWAFIPFQVQPQKQHRAIQGWAVKDSLVQASQDEVAAAASSRAPAPPPAAGYAPPVASPPAAASTAPAAAGEPPRAERPSGEEETVRYSQPIKSGGYPVQGHTLEELVQGVPAFPPIAGLPEAVWQKPCSSCHNWNRQTLCQQALIYAQDIKMTMRNQHPYGGPEKLAMRNWAQHGCQ